MGSKPRKPMKPIHEEYWGVQNGSESPPVRFPVSDFGEMGP